VAWAVIDAYVQVVVVLTTLCGCPPIAWVSIDRIGTIRWLLASKKREITGKNRPGTRGRDNKNEETHLGMSILIGIRLFSLLDSSRYSLSDFDRLFVTLVGRCKQ
jgi:hypothetical protein